MTSRRKGKNKPKKQGKSKPKQHKSQQKKPTPQQGVPLSFMDLLNFQGGGDDDSDEDFDGGFENADPMMMQILQQMMMSGMGGPMMNPQYRGGMGDSDDDDDYYGGVGVDSDGEVDEEALYRAMSGGHGFMYDEDDDEEGGYLNPMSGLGNPSTLHLWLGINQDTTNALDFCTFQQSVTESIQDIALSNNSYMREIVGDKMTTLQRQPTLQDLNSLKTEKSQEVKYDQTQVQNVIKRSKEAKEQNPDWNIFCDYSMEDEEDDEEEPVEDDLETEWKTFGVDIKRLQIGDWSPSRHYHGQQRLKINSIEKTLCYTMYQNSKNFIKN
jgi:hypothetical protein